MTSLGSRAQWGGGHRTYFLDGGDNESREKFLGGGDTAHNLLIGGLLGWGHRTTLKEKLNWVVGSVLAGNNTTLWLHLASWNLLDSQLS